MGIANSTELREMVREILREAMAGHRSSAASGALQSVQIASDADLQAFVTRLARPGGIEAVRSGKLKFALADNAAPVAAVRGSASTQPVLHGVVSERVLNGVAAGSTVILAPGAVLTPLARDAGRRLGLKFERRG